MSIESMHVLAPGHPRPPIAATSLDLLDRSRGSLLVACRTGDAGERYVEAHLGALRAAAALLAARSSSTGRSRPRSVWEVLPTVAPELSEWAMFFAGSARQRAAVERGGPLSARESDDLLRQAEIFLEIIQDLLGVPRAEPLPDYIAPVSMHDSAQGASAREATAREATARATGSRATTARATGSRATGSRATGSREATARATGSRAAEPFSARARGA